MPWLGISERRPPFAGRRVIAAVLAFVSTLGLANPAVGASYTIQAQNYEFVTPGGGSSQTVPVGAQVTWVASGDPHTVTSGAPGAQDDRFTDHPASAGLLTSGDTFATTFTAPGTYPYFCEIHPEQMAGVIIVVAAATVAPTVAPTRAPTPRPSASGAPATSAPKSPAVTAPPTVSATPRPTPSPIESSPPATQAGATSASQPTESLAPFEPVAGESAAADQVMVIVAILGFVILAGLGAVAYLRRRRPS